jgi:hypothetical protein
MSQENTSMNSFLIQLQGQVDVTDLNLMSPHHMTHVQDTPEGTLVSICTDQSGMIGLIRHLHALGYTITWIKHGPLP